MRACGDGFRILLLTSHRRTIRVPCPVSEAETAGVCALQYLAMLCASVCVLVGLVIVLARRRLQADIDDVKRHPWFDGVDWRRVAVKVRPHA